MYLFSFIFLLVSGLVFGALFIRVQSANWNTLFNFGAGFENGIVNFVITTAVVVIGIIVHELLHGIFFAIYAKHGFKSIKIGFVAKYSYAYCECKDIMRTNQYIVGLMLPTVILGIIPAIISIFIGNVNLWAFGVIFISAGGGDTLILTKIFRDRNETWFENLASIPELNVYRPIK